MVFQNSHRSGYKSTKSKYKMERILGSISTFVIHKSIYKKHHMQDIHRNDKLK